MSELDLLPKPRDRVGARSGVASALELPGPLQEALDLASGLFGCFVGENREVLGFLTILDFSKPLGSEAALEQLAYCGCPARHPVCKPPCVNDPQLLMHQHDLQPLASIEIAHLALPRESLTQSRRAAADHADA